MVLIKSPERKEEENLKMHDMSLSLKIKGGEYYHATDQNSIPLVQSKLGQFIYNVLMVGGEIIQIWNQFGAIRGSSVSIVVAMLPDKKDWFNENTPFTLKPPPKIHLN